MFDEWKAKRPPRSEEQLLHEIYALEHSLERWKVAGRHLAKFVVKEYGLDGVRGDER